MWFPDQRFHPETYQKYEFLCLIPAPLNQKLNFEHCGLGLCVDESLQVSLMFENHSLLWTNIKVGLPDKI